MTKCELPKELIEAYEKDDLILFIGAGMSRLMGCKGWDELSNNLIESIFNYAGAHQIINSNLDSRSKITIINAPHYTMISQI